MKEKIIKGKEFNPHQKNSSFFGAGFSIVEIIIYLAIFTMISFDMYRLLKLMMIF